MKYILTIILAFTVLAGYGQKKKNQGAFNFINLTKNAKSKLIIQVDYIDSTMKAVDTTYRVEQNMPIRLVFYTFNNLDGKKMQAEIEHKYDGKTWVFYRYTSNPFVDRLRWNQGSNWIATPNNIIGR